jgi:hypothetical protein
VPFKLSISMLLWFFLNYLWSFEAICKKIDACLFYCLYIYVIDINALPLWSVIGNIKEQQYLNNVNEM